MSRRSASRPEVGVRAVTGLLLKQLAYPEPNFAAEVLEPLLGELTSALVAGGGR